MTAALWNLSFALLLGSVHAIVAEQYIAHAVSSAQKSVSVNSHGNLINSQNGLLRQERIGRDPLSIGADEDETKLPGLESTVGKISSTRLELKKPLGPHSKMPNGSDGEHADLPKLLESESSAASDDEYPSDKELKKVRASDADPKASDGDADMRKLMASLGQTSDGNEVATKSNADFDLDKEFADLNTSDQSAGNTKQESLESLLRDLNKETPDLNKTLKALDDDKANDAGQKQLDPLIASMDSSSKDVSASLSQLDQWSPLPTTEPEGSALLQIKDKPDDSNMAPVPNNDAKSSDSDLEQALEQLKTQDQHTQGIEGSNSDEGLDKVMGDLASESKDNVDLDKSLKALEDESTKATDQKKPDDIKDVQESLNEINQMKIPSLLQVGAKPQQAERSKASQLLDEELAKIGDGWHPSSSVDTDLSLIQKSQEDSKWLDEQIKEHGDKIDPAADRKWLDDQLKEISSQKQDNTIAKLAQQKLDNA